MKGYVCSNIACANCGLVLLQLDGGRLFHSNSESCPNANTIYAAPTFDLKPFYATECTPEEDEEA